MHCKGSWIQSARNISYHIIEGKNTLRCELRRMDGTYEFNELKFSSKYEYHNNNGRFQWIFDDSILFLVINMKKNKDRWENISKNFEDIQKKYKCDFVRVEGIDGKAVENLDDAKEILKPRGHLFGKNFKCLESHENWIYDGTVAKSFPGLGLKSHFGTKGLTLSNMKCLELARTGFDVKSGYRTEGLGYNWYCIVEDDSVIDEDVYNKIVARVKNSSADVILLDQRGGWGGTCAMLYNQRIINNMIENMHPLSNFSIINEEKYNRGANLWDWKLWVYLANFNIRIDVYPLVPSGAFKSEIS